MKFSDKLKKLRADNGITQDELAEKLFVSRSAISKWETDAGYPSLESLKQLSKLFQITIDELISDEDINNKILLDEKERKKLYWVAVAFVALALVFTLLTYFLENKLFNIGTLISVIGYITFGILQKPKEKRMNLKAITMPYIISRLVILAIIVGVFISAFTQ